MSGVSIDGKSSIAGISAKDLINRLPDADPMDDPTDFFNRFIMTTAGYAAHNPKLDNGRKIFAPILMQAIQKLAKIGHAEEKSIVISSERLCDNSASFLCDSRHTKFEWEFCYIQVCNAISQATAGQALISVCLREPIKYLRSKYLRTFIERRATKACRDLSPSEFIQKQATLEASSPGTSALTPAMHAEFIKQLQQRAFVKAYGFQELLASDDVFSLMGLQGEEKYAFRDFSRENKLSFSKEQERAVEIEIIHALKQNRFYDRIMKSQLFE